MASEPKLPITAAATTSASTITAASEKLHRSVFEVQENFFDSCNLLPSPHSLTPSSSETSINSALETVDEPDPDAEEGRSQNVASRWTCNTCKTEFESLKDQRSHFKSDIHRFNVILVLSLISMDSLIEFFKKFENIKLFKME